MDNTITGPTPRDFNPAALVYKNDEGDKVLDLDAKMAWFHWLKPGWRITIDGLRVFGMETYVNNTYEIPDKPGEYISRREKEIIYQAVAFISMLDSKSVRVASVPMNIDASDPDFCGKLFEDGAEFLLDFCGFNVYNITKAQWEAAMEEKLKGRKIKPNDPAYEEMQNQAMDNLYSNKRPESIDDYGVSEEEQFNSNDADPFEEEEEEANFNNMPITNQGETDLSAENVMNIYNSVRMLPIDGNQADLEKQFDRYCMREVGDFYNNLDITMKYELYQKLQQHLKDGTKLN